MEATPICSQTSSTAQPVNPKIPKIPVNTSLLYGPYNASYNPKIPPNPGPIGVNNSEIPS